MYAQGGSTQKLSDKDLEVKLKVLKEILEFKFKIPPNIYRSLFATMVSILTQRIELAKDFLLTKALDVLDTLCDAQNAETAFKEALDPALEFIKWSLTLIREKNDSN